MTRPTLNGFTWGAGQPNKRQHVIEDISIPEGWITCGVDGQTVEQGAFQTLEAAWDTHRGVQFRPSVHRAAQLADDVEVHEFLARIEDEEWESLLP